MSKFSRNQIVTSETSLRRLLDHRYTGNNGINHMRYNLLIDAIRYDRTPQGTDYWTRRYYWFATLDIPGASYTNSEAMSDDDWSYLASLTPRIDSFLTEEGNKEYVHFALAISSKV